MNQIIFLKVIITLASFFVTVRATTGKIVNFGSKLEEIIEQHPDKNWLIKFYVPWCYHCQQLEPLFMNVAEHIYHNHDNLIVGRVDCTKYGQICDKYEVRSYPKIAYLNKNTHISYRGDRSAKSIIEFAQRLNGPDIKFLDNCNDLDNLINDKSLIVLYADMSDKYGHELYETFKLTATSQKSRYWFYQIKQNKNCKKYNIDMNRNGIYLIKKGLNNAIKYEFLDKQEKEDDINKSKNSFINWIDKSSIPIYGSISSPNLDHYLSYDKSLVIAILDEYQHAKKFSQLSKKLYELFGNFVEKFINSKNFKNNFIFGYTTDLDLINSIIIGNVLVPNLIILRPNYTYHLFINDEKDINASSPLNKLPKKLDINNLELILLSSTKLNQLVYEGGNSYLYSLLRQIYGQYNVFINMYKANPLLASILIGLPSIILMFVIYTTCFYDGPSGADYESDGDGDDDDYGEQNLNEKLHSRKDDDDDDDDDGSLIDEENGDYDEDYDGEADEEDLIINNKEKFNIEEQNLKSRIHNKKKSNVE